MEDKLRVGILGARGEVGQRYIALLQDHPWFDVVALTGTKPKPSYEEAVGNDWYQQTPMPESIKSIPVTNNLGEVIEHCDFVFSALPADVAKVQEPQLAQVIPVVSNASAYRKDPYVPMIISEINGDHAKMIAAQQSHYGREGFIAVKPNCSIQSFMLPIYALLQRGMTMDSLAIATKQAVSGAGRNARNEMNIAGNILRLPGEEDKARTEPRKILGSVGQNGIALQNLPILAQCYRVDVDDGHTASVFINTKWSETSQNIIDMWNSYEGLHLPSAPQSPLRYVVGEDRPNPLADKNYANGMGITIGGLHVQPGMISFSATSHNTIRGAAGGAILMAEQLVEQGYIKRVK